MDRNATSRAALALAALAAAAEACADDLYGPFATPHTSLAAFAGAAHTDNATLVPGGPADTSETLGVYASVYRSNERLQADLEGLIEQVDYQHHSFGGQTIGHGNLAAAYRFVPELFVWTLQDSYGQATLNPFSPSTPANRINANYGSTGPDLDFRVGSGVDLLLGGRYSRADFESNPLAPVNSHTLSGTAGLRDRLSATSAVSLNVESSRIEYQEPGHPSYDYSGLFGRYEARGARTGIAVDAGIAQAREAGETSRSPLLRLTMFRRLTPSWNLNLTTTSVVQNSGQALQSALSAARVLNGQRVTGPATSSGSSSVPPAADILLAQSPYRSQSAMVALDFVRTRTSLDLSGGFGRERAEFGATTLDRNLANAGVAFGRRMRPTLDFRLAANYVRRSPVSSGVPGDRTSSATGGFDWQPGRLITLSLSYSHDRRSADFPGASYVVNEIYLGINCGAPRPHVAFATAGANPVAMPPK